jgi:hypothetical protein
MKVCSQQFNIFFASAILLALLCGCRTDKQEKQIAALRVFVEVNPDSVGASQTVSVLRSDPVLVTVGNQPILTEANIIGAKIINTPGSPAIEVQFDESGAWMLEQYSASNQGRHFVIFGQWGEKLVDGRWLAAPIITRPIANGLLSFWPDASRKEMDELVLGLNNLAKENLKGSLK